MRVLTWLQNAYPRVKFTLFNRAVGSTSSLYGMHVIKEYEGIDLLFVDYGLNDIGSLAHHGKDVMLAVTEQIIRYMMERGTEVIYLQEGMYGGNIEETYKSVLDYYNSTMLSYRLAVADEVFEASKLKHFDPTQHLHGSKVKYSIYWTREPYRPHPNWVTHQLITDMITAYISTLGARVKQIPLMTIVNEVSLKPSVLSLPPILYGSEGSQGNALAGAVMCHPALTVYSTVPNEKTTKTFEGESIYFYRNYKPYHEGWEYKSDIPGKPLGWIADSSTRLANQSSAHIMFPILLSSGEVSITYLSSYENCGVVEIWISYIDPSTLKGKVKVNEEAPPKNLIKCCNESHHKLGELYPSKWLTVSQSAFLDTLDTTSAKVSEMRTVTYNFGVSGSFAINLLHTRHGEEDLKRRKGDKVKILGIKSC